MMADDQSTFTHLDTAPTCETDEVVPMEVDSQTEESLDASQLSCVSLCPFVPPLGKRDSSGKPVCELCEIRFQMRVKGPKHVYGPGYICKRCYNEMRRAKRKRKREEEEEAMTLLAEAAAAATTNVAVTPRRTQSTPLLLSPEQKEVTKHVLKSASIGTQGRSLSFTDRARIVRAVHKLQIDLGLTPDKAVKAVAEIESSAPFRVRHVTRKFVKTGDLTPTAKKKRITVNDPLHPRYLSTGPSLSVQRVLFREVEKTMDNNAHLTLDSLRQTIKEEIGTEVPRSTLHYWMHENGIKYGVKKFTNLDPAYADARIRHFLMEYVHALKEEEKGKGVLVWMDESYIYANHCPKRGWYFHRDKSVNQNRVKGNNGGKRIIILHAMTRHGMLAMPNVDPSNILSEVYNSCSVVFAEVCADEETLADYHNTITGEKFIGWLRHRLLPTFKAMFPNKTMYLVLDNAKYHHHRGPDWITPRKMKRGPLARFLRDNGVPSITCKKKDGNTVTIMADKFSADATKRAGGPNLTDLRAAVKAFLDTHPAFNTTVPQQLMSDAKHFLIYTPPYETWLQPIEFIWAWAKHEVATKTFPGRTWQETEAQTYATLDSVTPKLCASVIRHVEDSINVWLSGDSAGSLGVFQNLEGLKAATKEELDKCPDVLMEKKKDVQMDDEEEKEEEEE